MNNKVKQLEAEYLGFVIQNTRIIDSLVNTNKELKQKLLDVDFELARLEDQAHGEWGKDITRIRGMIAQ